MNFNSYIWAAATLGQPRDCPEKGYFPLNYKTMTLRQITYRDDNKTMKKMVYEAACCYLKSKKTQANLQEKIQPILMKVKTPQQDSS